MAGAPAGGWSDGVRGARFCARGGEGECLRSVYSRVASRMVYMAKRARTSGCSRARTSRAESSSGGGGGRFSRRSFSISCGGVLICCSMTRRPPTSGSAFRRKESEPTSNSEFCRKLSSMSALSTSR